MIYIHTGFIRSPDSI